LDTAGNPLIRDYQGYFSEGYRDLRERVLRLDEDAAAQLGAGPVARIGAALARNAERVRFWHEFVPIALPAMDANEIEAAVRAAGEAINAVLRRKSAAPLETVALTSEEAAAISHLVEVVRLINEYNAAVGVANTRIAAYKAGLSGANPDQVRSDLNRLRATKSRHLPEVAQKVDAHTALETQKRTAEDEKAAARRRLDEYAAAVIARYQDKINGYLATFGATFRLGSLTENYAGGQPGCQYGIMLRETAVPLAGSPGTVRFKTVLSGGDKRSLALAFFFSRLDESANLADTRVVLDDPMCSLDRSRRFATARRTVRLARDAKQVVLLSHDPVFLRLVWDETRDAGIEETSLSVERDGNAARVVPWDIEEATAPDFYKQLQAIDGFITSGSGDLLSLKRSFRPLLETHLRQSRPRAFGPKVWLGDMITMIRDAAPGSNLVPLQSMLGDLTDINSFTRDDHHGANPGAGPDPPDPTELRTMARRTLSVLGWA
jgi:wobble nucleotide-excising tRNase